MERRRLDRNLLKTLERETEINPRRPAWETGCQLKIRNIASTALIGVYREHPVTKKPKIDFLTEQKWNRAT